MWSERIRSTVRKKGSDTLPRLYLPANHRKAIKGATTAMAWGGMVLAFIVLPQPINIAFTVGLFVVERTLNRIVYRFPTIFVPALITRELRDVGFHHLAVATVTSPPGQASILFLGFPSCDAAEELFATFAEWCGQAVEPRTIDDSRSRAYRTVRGIRGLQHLSGVRISDAHGPRRARGRSRGGGYLR